MSALHDRPSEIRALRDALAGVDRPDPFHTSWQTLPHGWDVNVYFNCRNAAEGSLNAAMHFKNAMLPDANFWSIEAWPDHVEASVGKNMVDSGHWLTSAEHPACPATALLLACLNALIAKEAP